MSLLIIHNAFISLSKEIILFHNRKHHKTEDHKTKKVLYSREDIGNHW